MSIKEITWLELAAKIESGAELSTVERMAAGAMVRGFVKYNGTILKAQKKAAANKRKFADDKERYYHHYNKKLGRDCDCSCCAKIKKTETG